MRTGIEKGTRGELGVTTIRTWFTKLRYERALNNEIRLISLTLKIPMDAQ